MTMRERTKNENQFQRELASLAIPLALQNLLNALVGASDALMLGRLTQDAVAAVSLANQISFVMSLFTGTIIGAISIIIAQYWGKKDYEKAKHFLGMAVRYVFVISIVFFLLSFCIPTRLMGIFTTDKELIRIGSEYLRIVSFSYLFSGVSQCFLMMMKISGFAKMSVWISVITVTIDMSVDFFLIYGIGKVPALGANGSAYSTIAVELIALLWCIIWSRKISKIHPNLHELCFYSKEYEKDIGDIIPGMLASNLSWGLSISVHSFILGHLGSDATAAASVTNIMQQMIQCLAHGFSSGAGIMIGQELGRNQLDKAKEYGKRFWKVATLSGIINILCVCIVGPIVYAFYVLTPQAKAYLFQMMIMSAFYLFAFAYNSIITCGIFPAGGDSKYDAISVFFSTWCFAIPLAMLGCFVFQWSVILVYIIMCMDEIIKVPFIFHRYHQYIWLKNLTR